MLSPTMTVLVLAVLWLIVVVPMVVRRNDERRRERSVDGFGRAMRALGRRTRVSDGADVFVPAVRTADPSADLSADLEPDLDAAAPVRTLPTRRPVPVAQEALMYPVDRSEMSEARAQMMARRRRSLGILGLGTLIFLPLALAVGGMLWLLALPFTLGLGGYLWFLRSQALRDRERRHNRMQRALERRVRSSDLTAETDEWDAEDEDDYAEDEHYTADSVVRIDDDDIELHSMDTIDLTGLYSEDAAPAIIERRAS